MANEILFPEFQRKKYNKFKVVYKQSDFIYLNVYIMQITHFVR